MVDLRLSQIFEVYLRNYKIEKQFFIGVGSLRIFPVNLATFERFYLVRLTHLLLFDILENPHVSL